jgi:PAS domain S-box-containing protein
MKDKTNEQPKRELTDKQQLIIQLEKLEAECDRLERELLRANQALRMLSECSQALVRATDELDLLNEICRIIVEVGGYRMVWVGFAEQDEKKTIRPVAFAGADERYLNRVNITWADTEEERRPTSIAIRTGAPSVARHILTDPNFQFLRAEALKYGYASLIALPLVSWQALGVLNIYGRKPDDFDPDEVELLMDLADNVAHGITALRRAAERKQTEKALQESESKYRTIFETTAAAKAIVEADMTISLVNRQFEKLCGYSKEEIEGKKKWTEFVATSDLERMKEYHRLRRTDPSAAPTHYEFQFVDRSGNIKDILVNVDLIPGTESSVASLVDITERKQAEVERRELERKAYLSRRLATVGQMAAGVAHEINNPLTAVVGFTELLMKRNLPPEVIEDLKLINNNAQRVANIVRRLLTFARHYHPERSFVNINELIEAALELRAYELRTGNIKVITELDPELPKTMADGGRLQEVFLNLIINAEDEMKRAHQKGTLLIKTERVNDTIRISFKDDGPGIPKENLERIFEPFFTTKKVGQGTGLGLSICHGIISEHNGRIYVESELGKGATFIVELPLVKEEKKEISPDAPGKSAAREATKAKILVVDDEPTITQFLSRMLKDQGYEVETTDNAETALKLIQGEKYNLILVDVRLPGMGGVELYERLDEIAESLTQRIVFITGDVLGTETKDFFSRTNAPYITKPFNIEQLKEEIKRRLT